MLKSGSGKKWILQNWVLGKESEKKKSRKKNGKFSFLNNTHCPLDVGVEATRQLALYMYCRTRTRRNCRVGEG